MAEDEPRCEILRQENEALTKYIHECKDKQVALHQTLKDLKASRAALLQRKVFAFILRFNVIALMRIIYRHNIKRR